MKRLFMVIAWLKSETSRPEVSLIRELRWSQEDSCYATTDGAYRLPGVGCYAFNEQGDMVESFSATDPCLEDEKHYLVYVAPSTFEASCFRIGFGFGRHLTEKAFMSRLIPGEN